MVMMVNISEIIGINNLPVANGLGEYAKRMEVILKKNIVSYVMDKRKKDLDYAGNKVYGYFPPVTNGYMLNYFLSRIVLNKYYKGKYPHLLNPFYYLGSEYKYKSIVTIHDTYYKWRNEKLDKLYSKLIKKYSSFKNIISISEQTANELIGEGYDRENITVMYHYIEPVFRKLDNIEKDGKTVITVGDGVLKNNVMVRNAIKEKYYHIHVGRDVGADENYFRVSNEELVKLYNRASVLIRLSDYEGFGYPPLEALFCGTPVVVSDIAIFRELLNDSAVFVKKDKSCIVDGLEYAIQNREYILKIFESKIKNRYTRETFIDKMNRYYESI